MAVLGSAACVIVSLLEEESSSMKVVWAYLASRNERGACFGRHNHRLRRACSRKKCGLVFVDASRISMGRTAGGKNLRDVDAGAVR